METRLCSTGFNQLSYWHLSFKEVEGQTVILNTLNLEYTACSRAEWMLLFCRSLKLDRPTVLVKDFDWLVLCKALFAHHFYFFHSWIPEVLPKPGPFRIYTVASTTLVAKSDKEGSRQDEEDGSREAGRDEIYFVMFTFEACQKNFMLFYPALHDQSDQSCMLVEKGDIVPVLWLLKQ